MREADRKEDEERPYTRDKPVYEIPEPVTRLILPGLREYLTPPGRTYQQGDRSHKCADREPDIARDEIRLIVNDLLEHIYQSEQTRSQQNRRKELRYWQFLGEEHDESAECHQHESKYLAQAHLCRQQSERNRS